MRVTISIIKMILTNQIVLIIHPRFKEREEPQPDPDQGHPADQQQQQNQQQQQDMQQPAVQLSIPENPYDDSHHYEEPVATTKQIRQPDVSQTRPDNDPYIPDMADQSSSPQGQRTRHFQLSQPQPLQRPHEETSTEAVPR
jgi:hypothetical protein